METLITDTEGRAIGDTNEKRVVAQARALECLQTLCAKEQGILTITPSGWYFSFPRGSVK